MAPRTIQVKIPALGGFEDVPVIEVHVKPGDAVKRDDSVLTVESDKATMDVPAPEAGTVRDLAVKVGDRVSEGSLVVVLEPADDVPARPPAGRPAPPPPEAVAAPPLPLLPRPTRLAPESSLQGDALLLRASPRA